MIDLRLGDCIEVMRGMNENSIDTVVTDPPGGIDFMGKQWDDLTDHEPKTERGKTVSKALTPLVDLGVIENWEAGFLLFTVDWASEALRVLKPGAAGLVWSIPRTSDLTQFGLRLAGFRIVDVVSHLYGSGFPKNLSIGKSMDKHFDAEREVVAIENKKAFGYADRPWKHQPDANVNKITDPATPEAQKWDGWGTALKPAHEDWILVYKPREGTYVNNALTWGVAGLWIDGGRVPTDEDFGRGGVRERTRGYVGIKSDDTIPAKPASELGRFPANLIHDGSDEVLRGFPESKSNGEYKKDGKYKNTGDGKIRTWDIEYEKINKYAGDSGSAARFFYCAKASRSERNAGLEGMEIKQTKGGGGMNNTPDDVCGKYGSIKAPAQNHHPTVKPIALMEYLVRLTKTPDGGVVLDPFMGSGTTGIACVNEGRDFIGIEQSPEYLEIARRRIEYAEQNKTPEQPTLFDVKKKDGGQLT